MASVAAEKTELKEEGIIEAATELAQDPESKVNPDKVEEKLVEETREAGAPAYQFDPDASPEDKAAAAKAVCHPAEIVRSYTNHDRTSGYRLVSTTTRSLRAWPSSRTR